MSSKIEELENLLNESLAEAGKETSIKSEKAINDICLSSVGDSASNPLPQVVERKSDVNSNLPASAKNLSEEPKPAALSGLSQADIAAEESYREDKILSAKEQELYGKTLMFDTYIDLISYFEESINKNQIYLHLWQMEVGNFISNFKASIQNPLKFALCASNGSGKDSFCIAPLAVWFILCKSKSRVVVTSSSGVQLTAQTETYIRNLCETINTHMAEIGAPKAFKINQRYIRCLLTGSEIRMYATDEPGKAEGYHPMEPNAPFLIIVNEAKSVDELIFGAISRCTGFSHKVYVSSPAEPKGEFYQSFKWGLEGLFGWHCRRVTSYDCTHIPKQEIDADKVSWGEHSALFRSKHLALFTTIGGMVLLTDDAVNKCKLLAKEIIGKSWPLRVGLDLAAGGDESVISIWRGNQRVYQYTFLEKDTTITADIIDRELTSQGISKTSEYIRADDGGIGKGIIDNLKRKGWTNIRRIHNQSAALNKREFGNKGAEMWFTFKRLVEECLIPLPVYTQDKQIDQKFLDQLVGRHYKQSTGSSSRLFLQDKAEAKAEGYPSPDRVDAAVLAMMDVTVEMLLKGDKEDAPQKAREMTTIESVLAEQEKHKYKAAEMPHNADLVNWTNPDYLGQEPKSGSRGLAATHSLSEFL